MGGIPNPPVGWAQWLADGLKQELPKCATCGHSEHTRGQICPTVLADRQARNVCWHCGEEYLGTVNTEDVRESDGSLRTYYSWQHANGDTHVMPYGPRVTPDPPINHLEYWARERERNEVEERQRAEWWRPIETRSIEEQQQARERGPMEVPMVSTASTASMAQSQRDNGWATIVSGAYVRGPDQKPKKLPIVKPTKRKFNFDAQS